MEVWPREGGGEGDGEGHWRDRDARAAGAGFGHDFDFRETHVTDPPLERRGPRFRQGWRRPVPDTSLRPPDHHHHHLAHRPSGLRRGSLRERFCTRLLLVRSYRRRRCRMAFPPPPLVAPPPAAPAPGFTSYAPSVPAPMMAPPPMGMPFGPPPIAPRPPPPPPPGIHPVHPTAAAAAYSWMAAACAPPPGALPPGYPPAMPYVFPLLPGPSQTSIQGQMPPGLAKSGQLQVRPASSADSSSVPRDLPYDKPESLQSGPAHAASSTLSPREAMSATARGSALEDQTLDMYAPRYVPLWLRKANEATDVTCIPFFSVPPPDYGGYAQSFLPLPLLHSANKRWLVSADAYPERLLLPQPKIEHDYDYNPRPPPPFKPGPSAAVISTPLNDTPQHLMPARDTSAPFKIPLDPKSYAAQLSEIVRLEVAARENELKKHALYQARLRPIGEKYDELFEVSVPGLREERPRVTPGDTVQLRPVSVMGQLTWHIAFEAQIWNVDTFRGTVAIRAPGLRAYLWRAMGCALALPSPETKSSQQWVKPEPRTERSLIEFNVLWTNPIRELASAPLGLSVFGAILEQDWALRAAGDVAFEGNVSMAASLLHTWLFPTRVTVVAATERDERASVVDGAAEGPNDGAAVRFRDQRLNPLGYYDDKLNEEQMEAVEYLATYRPQLPFLIDGPPGTGKTKTMCEAVLQILLRQPRACILLVAPSSTAADTLALRISATLHPDTLFRLNPAGRSMATLPVELLPYSHLVELGEKTVFGMPPVAELLHKRVVVSTTVDCELLFKSRCTNADLQLLRRHSMPLTHPRIPETDSPLHWTHLLIDEAGQGTEAEFATPLACVLPAPGSQRWPTLSLCGDMAQLGPRIQSSRAATLGLDLSLLERLLRRRIYQEALQQIREQQKRLVPAQTSPGSIAPHVAPKNSVKLVCALRRNYRARHPALIAVPSTLWYADALVPAAQRSYTLQAWPGFPNPKVPILFENLADAEDVAVDDGVSWHSKSPCRARKSLWLTTMRLQILKRRIGLWGLCSFSRVLPGMPRGKRGSNQKTLRSSRHSESRFGGFASAFVSSSYPG